MRRHAYSGASLITDVRRASEQIDSLVAIGDLAVPTRLPGWTARHLVAHLYRDFERLALACTTRCEGAPAVDDVTYWRSYDRTAIAARTTARAAEIISRFQTDDALIAGWRSMWRQALEDAASADPRTVVTTWGPTMQLHHLIGTRLLEVVVHGLDLADARGTPRVVDASALSYVDTVLQALAPSPDVRLATWDDVTWIEKAAGRIPLTSSERVALGERAHAIPLLA